VLNFKRAQAAASLSETWTESQQPVDAAVLRVSVGRRMTVMVCVAILVYASYIVGCALLSHFGLISAASCGIVAYACALKRRRLH